jgi:hypothetical protein
VPCRRSTGAIGWPVSRRQPVRLRDERDPTSEHTVRLKADCTTVANKLLEVRHQIRVGLRHAARDDEAFSIGRALAADDPEVGQVGDLDRRTA